MARKMTTPFSKVSVVSSGQLSDELFEAHNEQPLTTNSTIQLKNRLKRSLLNEPSSYDKISKVRVTKNSDDELEVIQLNVNSCTLSNKHHELNEIIERCLTKNNEKLQEQLANDCKKQLESINDKTIKNILKSSEIQNAVLDTIDKCLTKYNDKLQEKLVKEREFNTELLKLKEKAWQSKYDSISKQLKELQTLMQTDKNDFKLDVNSKPDTRTRTVCLQELICAHGKSENEQAHMTTPPVIHMTGDYQPPDKLFKVHSGQPSTSTSSDNDLTNGLTFPLQGESSNDEMSNVQVSENINITINYNKYSSTSSNQPALESIDGSSSQPETVSNIESPSKLVEPLIFKQQNSHSEQLLAVSPVPGKLESVATTSNTCQVPASQLTESLSPTTPIHRYIPLIKTKPTAPFQIIPKKRPPAPAVHIKKCSERKNSISLIWDMSIDNTYAKIQNYQIFFYQERGTNAFKWRRIFVSEALDLPITAYISQLMHKEIYHFAIRATDIHGRVGPISRPTSVCLM